MKEGDRVDLQFDTKGSKVSQYIVNQSLQELGKNGMTQEEIGKILNQLVPIIQEALRRNSRSYKIEQAIKEFNEFATKTIKEAKDFAAAKIEGGIAICQNSFNETIEFGSKLIDEIKEFMPVMKEALEKAFESMMSKANSVVKATEKFIESAKEIFEKAYNDISKSVTKFVEDLVSAVKKISEDISKNIGKVMEVGKEFLNKATETVKELSAVAKVELELVKMIARYGMQVAGEAINDGLDQAKEAAKELATNARIGLGATGVVLEHGAKATSQAVSDAGNAVYDAGKAGLNKARLEVEKKVLKGEIAILSGVSSFGENIAVGSGKLLSKSTEKLEDMKKQENKGKGNSSIGR